MLFARHLPPGVEIARRTSRVELSKINCKALQILIAYVASELARVVRAVGRIAARIMRMFTTNAHHLLTYLTAISLASRRILNFVATLIKDTHGLKDFTAIQDVQGVVDELTVLRRNWERLVNLENTLLTSLLPHLPALELAMDPDHFSPLTSPRSSSITELLDAQASLTSCYSRTQKFFEELTVQEWRPPVLSPDDVKIAASSWKEVELSALGAVAKVRSCTRILLDTALEGQFITKAEKETALESLNGPLPTPAPPPSTSTAVNGAGNGVGREMDFDGYYEAAIDKLIRENVPRLFCTAKLWLCLVSEEKITALLGHLEGIESVKLSDCSIPPGLFCSPALSAPSSL
ncbi:hypothetical protein MNV49_004417 [Pseudohyphozyma bogoriensis]|nr:hypothetical protein MNV49_004417 [Pseudohyphozyma bogoriensis]